MPSILNAHLNTLVNRSNSADSENSGRQSLESNGASNSNRLSSHLSALFCTRGRNRNSSRASATSNTRQHAAVALRQLVNGMNLYPNNTLVSSLQV